MLHLTFDMATKANKKAAARCITKLQNLRVLRVENRATPGLAEAVRKARDLLELDCSQVRNEEKTLKELVAYFHDPNEEVRAYVNVFSFVSFVHT